jgi:hypothetical protein
MPPELAIAGTLKIALLDEGVLGFVTIGVLHAEEHMEVGILGRYRNGGLLRCRLPAGKGWKSGKYVQPQSEP